MFLVHCKFYEDIINCNHAVIITMDSIIVAQRASSPREPTHTVTARIQLGKKLSYSLSFQNRRRKGHAVRNDKDHKICTGPKTPHIDYLNV